MSENNKSYRIRTNVGEDKFVHVKLSQKFDILEILSLKLKQDSLYRLHASDYGVIVGRVLANNGFGIPNAKVSVFIQISDKDYNRNEIFGIYPYNSTTDKDDNDLRYNLLPDSPVNECHRAVGSFPSKTMVLDNDAVLEVYDTYYKYTTKTNESGDYMIFGVPTGNQTVHVDLDLSDIGILSQRPRDFVHKGYTIEQFENPNQFKGDGDLSGLSQIFSQDSMVEVIPFWGDESVEMVGISRNDVNIQFKFEPTCVFMGSVVSDNSSNGFSKKCVPTNSMGKMDELVTGSGTIEMIRKKADGSVEEFQIQGNQLINGDGIWCYQIPMNLDYMKTDEYGNMVPTDNPDKGIPTRARVRFRVSMQDFEENVSNYFRGKFLVPHNPKNEEEVDYAFGTGTLDSSYKDLFWNNVYTIKSYIPRIQKSTWHKTERFSGIKHCNIHANNNPIPYNNIRIRLPFMFTIICAIIKAYVNIVEIMNLFFSAIPGLGKWGGKDRSCIRVGDSLCPDLEGWYFAPGCSTKQKSTLRIDFSYGFSTGTYKDKGWWEKVKAFFSFGKWIYVVKYTMLNNTYNSIVNDNGTSTEVDGAGEVFRNEDKFSIDSENRPSENAVCLTNHIDYLMQCIEINLAQEYKVIQFDFYNDWVNGLIYIPRWMRHVRRKMNFLFGLIKIKAKVKGCMTDTTIFAKDRYMVQQCSIKYSYSNGNGYTQISANQKPGCYSSDASKQKCHKKDGKTKIKIFGNKGGLVNETKTLQKQNVYYFKPCEWQGGKKVNLFATDICLLGSLNDCDLFGIPQAFKTLNSSSYQIPTNLALTNLEEDGYMFSQKDSGTICTANNGYNSQEVVKQTENTFSGAMKHNSEYTYSGNDDVVPLTESAGIDWGYTGPGQGESIFNAGNIYQPGGHFLGISCSQAQTNIKSCINLSRICEHGVGMSQRVLIPKSYDIGTDTWHYTNVMPNGFISQDEIYDNDFRVMFATMNYNNLRTKRDEKTGYLKYDFIASLPNNFDGKFSKYSKNYKKNYSNSKKNKIKVDSIQAKKKTSDNEIEDVSNAVVRSLETTSLDYYYFRFGIMGGSSAASDKKYFLIEDGGDVSMPVYENSFYFYFGLRDGATALDEFRKQFFSTCKNTQDNVNVLTLSNVNFSIEDKKKSEYTIQDLWDQKINAVIKIDGGTMPYSIAIYNNNGVDVTKYMNIPTTNIYARSISIPLKHNNLGKYRIKVTDNEENTVTQDYNLGISSIITINMIPNDYFMSAQRIKETVNENDRKENCDVYGGYISWDGTLSMFGVNQEDYNSFSVSGVKINEIDLRPEDGEIVSREDGIIDSFTFDTMNEGTTSDNLIAFYPLNENEDEYTILLTLKDLKNDRALTYAYKTFNISDIKPMDYCVGSETFKYDTLLYDKPLKDWHRTLKDKELWEFKHCFTRQTINESISLSTKLFDKSNNAITVISGSPERIIDVDEITGEIITEIKEGYSNKSALSTLPSMYEGYDVSLNQIYGPTSQNEKQEYQYIVYDSKGLYGLGYQILTNKIDLDIKNEYKRIIGLSGLISGYRYLVINKNIALLPIAVSETQLEIDELDDEMFEIGENGKSALEEIVEGIPTQVFGFHSFPIYYKPFYFKVYAYTVSDSTLRNKETISKGWIYNGITYNNKFTSVICNGEDITDDIIVNSSSEISSVDREFNVSDKLKIGGAQYSEGEISFSCKEGTFDKEKYKDLLINEEVSVSFLFKESISVEKNSENNILTVNAIGDTQGVSYFVINADEADNNGYQNKLYCPYEIINNSWHWKKSSNWLNPTNKLQNTNYEYGDFMTADNLKKLSQTPMTELPEGFKGCHIEDISNKIGDKMPLSLSQSNYYNNAYILGVANNVSANGSSINALYFYKTFQTASYFKGKYDFWNPIISYGDTMEMIFNINISGKDTWKKINLENVDLSCEISGSVNFTDKTFTGEIKNGKIDFTNESLLEQKRENTDDGGLITFVLRNDELLKHETLTISGNTSLTITGEIKTGVNEDNSDIYTKITEVFNSKYTWIVEGKKPISSNEYVWTINVNAENDDNGCLKINISALPYYNEMTGGIADPLDFQFNCKLKQGGEENITCTMAPNTREKNQTYSQIKFDDINGDILGSIPSNPNTKMYSYDGCVYISKNE